MCADGRLRSFSDNVRPGWHWIPTRYVPQKGSKDSGGPYNYNLVTALVNTAKVHDLDFAIDVYPHYGSDVEATLRAGYDIRHGLIGPGVYASHNYERSHMDGVKNTYELVKAYVTEQ